ncbi:MAG: RNA 2',3'-cyclic phosphodiesterase [Chloroflexota bacterium]|jgi:2'-5' RNA ligase
MENQGKQEHKRRLFVAIEIAESWRQELARIRRELEPIGGADLKWVRPELLHITIAFLGYQPDGSLQLIESALVAASKDVSPFRITLGRLGCFGQPHNLKVLWVGITEVPKELQQLHSSVSAHLSSKGIPFDRKPLVPHITLARARPSLRKDTSQRIYGKFQGLSFSTLPPIDVTEFVLMESHLSRLGPEYQKLRHFPLSRDML